MLSNCFPYDPVNSASFTPGSPQALGEGDFSTLRKRR